MHVSCVFCFKMKTLLLNSKIENDYSSYILRKPSKCFCDPQKKSMNFPPFQAQLHILYVEA